MRIAFRLLIVSLLLWSGWACTDTLVDVVDVAVLEIEPQVISITPGESRQLQARVRDAEGNVLSGRTILWSSNAGSIASVSTTGMVHGESAGTARITATSEGVQGTADVTVSPAPVIIAQPDSVPLEALIDETETAAAAVAITNGGGGSLVGLAAAIEYDSGAGDWLDAVLSGTAAPATLNVSADADGLARGTYRASVRLTSTSVGAAPIVVRVVFSVLQRSPVPTLVSVTPNLSAREQSLDVIMTGSGYVPGLTTVSFGSGITVNNVNVQGPTTLTTSITVGTTAAVGTRTVTVTNPAPGGGSASLTNAFTVEGLNPRPTVTSVEPATAQQQNTLDVVISGTGFLDGITIADFGPGITINSADVTSASALTANITIGAAAATGIRDITVANPEPGGGVGTLRDAFTVTAANPPPEFTGVTPASAQRLQTVAVQLSGGNFSTALTSIDFGAGIAVSGMTVVSATTITANITIDASASLGPRAVSVTNAGPGGGTATLDGAFTVLDSNPAPVVQSVLPVSGRLAQTLDVAVAGTGFVGGVTTLAFGAGITVNTTSVADATSLTANISVAADAALGVRSVTATNAAPGGGSSTLSDAFTVVGAVSADLSIVTAAPSTNVAADGDAVSTVTVTLRDGASGAVTGLTAADFALSVTGSAAVGEIGETATPGTYTFTVSNTVAETVTVTVTAEGVVLTATPTITFVATVISATNSNVSADPLTGVTADGVDASVVTVTLRDANNNAIGGLAGTAFAIALGGSASATASDIVETSTVGTYTFGVTNTVAEQVTVSVSAGGVTLGQTPVITFVPGSGSAAHSSAVVPQGTAGAVTAIVITVRDASGNLVTGAASALAVSITGANTMTPAVNDNGDGTYSATYTPTVAGSDNVAITLGGVAIAGSPFTSVVSAGAISATVSEVTAAPATVVADGTAAATVTVILRDAHDNPIGGVAATDFVLTLSGGIPGTLSETTTAGTYTFAVTNTDAETVTVSVAVRGVTLDDEPTLQFTAGGVSATRSGATAEPSTGIVANGTAASTVTVTLRDASNNAIGGLGSDDFSVTVLPSGSAGTVSEIGPPGTYAFSVTNTVAQSVTVAVQVGGVTLSQQPAIQFVAGPATQVAINTGNNQSATIGTPVAIAPSVIVRDENSNPVSGVSVTFAVATGGGTLPGGTVSAVNTNASGIATSPAWTLGTNAGSNTLTATSAGLTGSPLTFDATGTAGSATQMSLTTQPSASAVSGAAFAQQPVIQLRDDSGNPVAHDGVVVTATIATGGGTLGGTADATTNASGVATFTNLSISGLVGDRTLEFTATGIATVASNAISITAAAATNLAVEAGDGQSATVGTAVAVAPSVIVTDASDNPIAGVSVTFAVASGDGSLASDGAVTTNNAGIATSPAWTLGATAGTNTLTASSAGLANSPITFSATGTSGAATQMTIETQPSATAQSGTAFAQQPVIQIRDGSNNVVAEAGIVIAATIASGGGTLGGTISATTNASGVATFTNLSITGPAGDRTLAFTSGGMTAVASGTISIGAGTATQLTITTQPSSTAQSGVALVQQPVIQLRDGGGNAVATGGTIVTAAIASGGGTLGGTLTATTEAEGIATFANLMITGSVGARTLRFTSGTLTAVTSATVSVTAGAATQMAVNGGDGQSQTAGQPVPFAPSVIVRDASGNPVTGAGVTFAVTSGGGGLAASGSVVTGAGGIATSPVWTLGTSTGVNTLTATSGSLPSVVFTANGVAGDAARLTITTQPSATAASGAAFTQQPAIQLRDSNGNAVSESGIMVTAAIASGGGTLQGTTVATTDAAGIATFATLAIAGTAGDRTLSFTSGALAAATSSAISITAGAATQVAINAGNNQSATIGTAVAIAPSVVARDANANPVAGVSVIFTVTSGGGSLSASGTVTTDASGIATSPAWTLGTTAGTNTLSATSAGLTGSPITFTATATAGAATQLTITTQPSATAASGAAFTQQPAVQLRDGGGNVVAQSGVVVAAAIASGDGTLGGTLTASTDASGLATFTTLSITGLVGGRTLSFTSGTLTAATSSSISITAGAATQIAINTGDGQSAMVGTAVAVGPSVIVRDGGSNPVAGVSVTFAVASGGGSLAASGTVTTDASGVATSPAWTLGTTAGSNTLTATSTGLTNSPITFTATGSVGDATQLTITTQPSASAASGAAFGQQPSIQLRDGAGNAVAQSGVIVTSAIATGDGTLSGSVDATTDGAGVATFTDLSITGVVGARTLSFTSGTLTAATSSSIVITAGAATQIAVNVGNNQSATTGTPVAIAPSVIVRDTNNNPVSGVGVTFAVTGGGGSLAASGAVSTNSSGIATSPAWTLGTTAGPNTLTATSGSLSGSPVTFTATGTAGTATQMSLTTQPSSSAVTGAAFAQQPVVQVRDGAGNPVADEGVVVTASIATGGGTLGGTVDAATNASGVATFTDLSISGLAGDRTLEFTATGLATVTSNAISITAGTATQVAINAGDGQSATVGTAVTVPPSVIVTDVSGNPIPGVSVTFAVETGGGSLAASGDVTTNGDGIATSPAWTLGTAAGSNTLTATSTGLTNSPITFTATGTSGAATQITIETQPSATAQSGAAFAQQPVIQIRDGSGNVVAEAGVVITTTIASGGGTLGGTVDATTNASGVATFTDLSITGAAGERTLGFTSGGMTPVVSGTISISAGAATQLTISTQPSSTAQSGVAFAQQPAIQLRDGGGNAVATAGVTVTAAIASGGGTLGGVTAVTDAAGVATFTDVTISGLIGNRTLTFSATGATPVTSGAINVTAGAAAQIAINSGNNQTSTAGQPVPFSPTVDVRDASGNRVAGVSVTFAVSSGGGSLLVSGSVVTDALGIATSPVWTLGTTAGENTLTATSAGLTGSPVVFTATGVADDASRLSITTQPSASAPSGAAFVQQPVVQLRDSNNNVVATSGVMVTAAIASGGGTLGGNPVATTDAAGIATFTDLSITGIAGARTLSFTSGSLTAATSSSIDITAGTATQVAINTGNNQSATVGTAVAVAPSVIVRDASSNPVAGVSVTFEPAVGSGSLAADGTVSTDASGIATSPAWTLGTTAGTHTLTATSTGLTGSPITFTATGTAGAATNMTITAQPSASAPSGAAFAQQPAVQLRDGGGNVVAQSGVVVTAAIASGDGALGGTVDATTDAAGLATFTDLSITGLVGARTLSFTSGALTAATSSAINIIAGAATQIAVNSGDGQSATAGTAVAVAPSVIVRDGGSNPVVGVSVTFVVASGGGSLAASDDVTTDASGIATSPAWTLGTTAGTNTLTATSAGLAGSTVTFTATGTVGAATQLTITIQPSVSAASGAAFAQQPAIQLRDGGGNAVAQGGVIVTAVIASGAGALGGIVDATTDAAGLATFTGLSITGLAGTRTLSFTSGTLTAATSSSINITAGAATQIEVNAGDGQSATAGTAVAVAPSVIVRDGGSNPVAGVSVTFAVASGDGSLAASGDVTTDASGVATSPAWTLGTTAGTNTLTATSAGLTGSPVTFTATGTVGAATQLTTTTQPSASAASGAAFTQQPAIQLRDGGGNAVAEGGVVVTAAIASGAGTLGGTPTATTDVSGVATFTDLSITGTAGARTLSFTSGTLTAATSSAIDITAGAATQIAVNGGDNQSATVETAVAVAPSVIVRDASLNPVSGMSVTFEPAVGSGSLAGSGIVTTDASGIATSPAWTLGTTAGANTLTATSTGLTGSPITFTATGTAGAATQLTITTQPSTSAASGTAFAPQPAIQLRDGGANAVAQVGVIVTATIASGDGTLGGTVEATTDAEGLATFTDLSITGLVGARTLSFTSGALTAATSGTIDITAGPATQIAVNGGDNQNATVGTAVAVAPSVIIRDAGLNPIAGVSVTFAVATGGGSLAAPDPVITDAAGIATSPAWTLGTTAGTNTLSATSGSLTGSPITFTATGTAGAATQLTITTQPSATAASGSAFAQQPAIQLRDSGTNVVEQSGVVVTAAIASGEGSLGGTLEATTDEAGLATFTDLSITGLVGERTLSFTSGALTVATSGAINVMAGAATQIAINAGDGQSATAATAAPIAPSVIVRDASLNPIAGVSVTFAVATGGGSLASTDPVITDAAGIATSPAWTLGTTAGTNTLTATSTGLTNSPITFTATGTAGGPTQLTITTQPSATAASGTAFAQQPAIQLRDSGTNVVEQSGVVVTAAIASGDGTLGGTLEATTDEAGLATFTDLSITGLVGERTLSFTSGALTAATSGTIDITTGAAATIAEHDGNNQSATAGTAVAVAPSVIVTDTGGNPIAGVSVTFAVASGDGSLATTDPVVTDAAGIAVSPTWTLGPVEGANTLTATADGLTGSPITFTASGTAP